MKEGIEMLYYGRSAGQADAFAKRSWLRSCLGPGLSEGIGLKAVLEGSEGYRLHGRHHPVRAGHGLLLNEGERFDYDFERTPALGFCLQVDAHWLRAVRSPMEDASLERAVTALGEVAGGVFTVPAAVAGYLAKLSAAAVADCDPTEAALRLATIIHQVDAPRAAWYVRLPCSRRGTRQWVAQVLERARTFLRDHALGPPVALSALAQEAGMSPYHLHRYFKAAFGYSPQRYQQQIQLAEAARRLLHSDAAVQEIAAAIGFDDPHYFGKLFKKRLGMRPLAYRAMNTEAPPAPEPLY